MQSDLVIDNDVILDGEGNLTLDTVGDAGTFSASGTAELRRLTVTNNARAQLGGEYWGCIHVTEGGTLTLRQSTVAECTCVRFPGHSGGGGCEPGIHSSGGTVTLANSTASRSDGSFAFIQGRGTLSLVHATVVGDVEWAGEIIASSSIIVPYCLGPVFSSNDFVVSNGYNIVGSGNCGFDEPTDQVNVTPEQLALGPLQDNGGPTETHALGTGSVAIDQVPADDCVDADGEPLTTDQRGGPRPETGGTMCDVGAFELQP